jgi:uncharacterized membrane protein YesL
MNYLPFIISLIIYIGFIIIHIIELATYNKSNSSIQCKTLCQSSTLRKNHINSNISGIVVSLIIIILTYVLCLKNKENLAWVVLILPFIIGFIGFLILINKVNNCNLAVDKSL